MHILNLTGHAAGKELDSLVFTPEKNSPDENDVTEILSANRKIRGVMLGECSSVPRTYRGLPILNSVTKIDGKIGAISDPLTKTIINNVSDIQKVFQEYSVRVSTVRSI